jgi:hypothetical protein
MGRGLQNDAQVEEVVDIVHGEWTNEVFIGVLL